MAEVAYRFVPTSACRMCGAPLAEQRVIGRRGNGPQGRNPRRAKGIAVSVIKCGRCGLIYADPMPIPIDIQDHYGVAAEQYWAPGYMDQADDFYSLHISGTEAVIGSLNGKKVLDVGTGIGKAMIALQKTGADTYGIEPSNTFRQVAIERLGISPERILGSTVEDAPVEAGTFDAVFFGVVLEHLPDPAAAMEKALQWLKPGGVISVEVPSAHWLVNRMANTYYRLRGSDSVANLSPMHEPYHLYEYTLKSFEAFAQRHGAAVVRHTYYVCSTFMPRWMDGPLRRWMKWTDTGMEIHVWIRKAG